MESQAADIVTVELVIMEEMSLKIQVIDVKTKEYLMTFILAENLEKTPIEEEECTFLQSDGS